MRIKKSQIEYQAGFTLMEIIVSTALFAIVMSALLVLFNNTLQINRRVQSVRQVSQGTRNFTEMIAREIRNGQIDYESSTNCNTDSYQYENNQSLAIINSVGERLCFYLDGSTLYLVKTASESNPTPEAINPPDFYIDQNTFRFIVRPTTTPKPDPAGGKPNPAVQPFVTILAQFSYRPANGQDIVTIPYQTSISTDVYDIPGIN
jgi:prepilin-type N-terminal cleavage/methylation domain-containing protein